MNVADRFNRVLLEHVRPPQWNNPRPARKYNLVVIGGGTAGLVTAAGAAGLGARVALIERNLLGGDCLNVGCVPSKTLIRSARAMHAIRESSQFGVNVATSPEISFEEVMRRVRSVRAHISPHDSAQRFSSLGVDVFLGEASFVRDGVVRVEDVELTYSKAVIASGARAQVPPVPGLDTVPFLTNESVFELEELPARLAVVGGGPIGCELAQAFVRCGSAVTLFERADQLLGKEDPEAAARVRTQLLRDGINVQLGTSISQFEARPDGSTTVFYTSPSQPDGSLADGSLADGGPADGGQSRLSGSGTGRSESFSHVLIAAGRAPNIETLNVEAVGVEFDARGIRVDDFLRTTNPRIFAAGDVCMSHKFTHAADFAARIVIQNSLFLGRKRLSQLVVPWVTYTDPEVAHVGLYEVEAAQQGLPTKTYVKEFADVDRALADGDTAGFVKILTHARRGTVLGGTIVTSHAGEMLSLLTAAVQKKLTLGSLASIIHPYPTQAEAIRQLGDAANRARLTPTIASIFSGWLRLQRW